jgi:hypothetical protein
MIMLSSYVYKLEIDVGFFHSGIALVWNLCYMKFVNKYCVILIMFQTNQFCL